MDNANGNMPVTFITEPVTGRDYFIVSCNYLREAYVMKMTLIEYETLKESGRPPHTLSEEERKNMYYQKVAEAQAMYPDQGDYKVFILDEEGNPVPMGFVVEFISAPVREWQGVKNCKTVTVTFEGVDIGETFVARYKDCFNREQFLTGFVRDLLPAVEFCTSEYTINVGVALVGADCVIGEVEEPSEPI